MTEARIGRLVAACLHQAIIDELPQRLDFYEHWLHAETLRDGAIGLAPLVAVLGFLRTEGEAYHRVMHRAGTLAGLWTLASMSAGRRKFLAWLPRRLRARAALRILRALVRDTCSTSRATSRLKGTHVKVEVRSSLFCGAREAQPSPLCGYYLAAATEVFRTLSLPAVGHLAQCWAVERSHCVMTLELATAAAVDPAMAA